VLRKAVAELLTLLPLEIGQAQEVTVEEAQQPVEGGLITAVGRCGQEHHVAGRGLSQTAQEVIALVAALTSRGAGVGLVHDHQLRAGAKKLVAASHVLDVVKADDGAGIGREDARTRREVSLKSAHALGRDGHGLQMEAYLQLADPLVNEVRRTEHGHALDVPAVEQLACDQRSLDRLTYADVVGDQKAHGVELEGHEQRDELVCARLERDLSEAAEGARPAAQGQEQGVAQEQGRVVTGLLLRIWRRETLPR
jgi:hypothetical protein